MLICFGQWRPAWFVSESAHPTTRFTSVVLAEIPAQVTWGCSGDWVFQGSRGSPDVLIFYSAEGQEVELDLKVRDREQEWMNRSPCAFVFCFPEQITCTS